MTRIWLARHAETATPTVFHGAESDEVLSEHGHAQAVAAADWFATQAIDGVVSTRMRRAIRTATPIAERCGVPLDFEEHLHERRVGALCGTSFSLSEGPWIETLNHWTRGETSFTTPGAESYDDLVRRIVPAFERVVHRHAMKRTVVVCHGIVVKVLLLTLVPGWGPTRWNELGKVHNLATAELALDYHGTWEMVSPLAVPPPVQRVDEIAAVSKVPVSRA